jgi:hypothetical protein
MLGRKFGEDIVSGPDPAGSGGCTAGPQFTYWKWVLAIVTPLVAVAGFVTRLV